MSAKGDNPIHNSAEDELGRAALAHAFAAQLLALDASEGLVVGVLGPWGSGKTSFVNMARPELTTSGAVVLDFNPWMFSGAEQLVESFFIELAAQLRLRNGLEEIGRDLQEYGESFSGLGWVPLIGPWIERGRGATKLVGKILQRKEGVGSRRAKLEKALLTLDKPILVILDDIDRLSTSEIRDVFRLVRLTASFPNVVYVLAFDRIRVESALTEQGVTGRDYLEKILQVAVDLPAVPEGAITRLTLNAVNDALSSFEVPGPFDAQVWPDVFMEVIRPLVRNMRDVRRYAASLQWTVRTMDARVALVDVLGLEAVRVFMPDVFLRLHGALEGLTTTTGLSYGGAEPPHLKMQIDELLEAAAPRSDIVRSLIERMFPAAQRHIGGSHYGPDWQALWLRNRRVAHVEIFRFYLERVASEGLQAFSDAEQAWSLATDAHAFDAYLRSLDAQRLQDVIGSLEAYEDDFSVEHAVPASVVLLNLLPELPERERGMFDLDTRMVVGRVTYRLLRAIGDPDEVEAAARQILPQLQYLSAKLELINDVGYREGVGHQLVSQAAARDFEREWRAEVRSASVNDLLRESDLHRILYRATNDAESDEAPLAVPESPELTLALIRAARSDARSQSIGSRAVHRSPRLAWEMLVEIYGDDVTLIARLNALKESDLKVDNELIDLAERYASGWRPNEDDD